MSKKLLSRFLLALICLAAGSVAVMAQTPEPTAKWTFDNTEDLLAPSVGNLTLTPCVIPANKSIATSTLSEAGIVTADGPAEGNKAIYVPKASALKLSRAEGAATSTAYTIMMDFKVPDANPFNGLLQMAEANNNDGDLFTNKNKIGIGSMAYAGNVQNDVWYRVVFTYNESNPNGSQANLYLNGKKIAQGGANTRHIMESFGFYLLCDEDGEKVDYTYLSEVAFWETPLTDEEACALGRAVPVTTMEIATPQDLRNFAQAINSGNEMNGVLTADIDMSGVAWDATAPIGVSACPFCNTFDGQGHKITGFNATCTADGGGLFGYTSGATIKDFSIYGNLTSSAGTGSGVIGYPSASVITGIHSYLDIDVPVGGVHHVGGVVGSARGSNTISGCTFHGSMYVVDGNTDNFAGIVAYLGGDKVEYCTNYGTITYAQLGCCAGGIAGYLNNTGSTVKGCLNLGKVACEDAEGTPSSGSAIIGRLRSHDAKKLTGNAWLEGSAYGAGRDDNGMDVLAAYSFTEDKLATGAVCYALNGDQTEIGWYQTLGTDEAPVLDSTHGQVFMVGRLHCNGDAYTDATYSNTYSEPTQDDHDTTDGLCSYCGLYFEDGLTPNADGYYEISNARRLAWFEQKVNKGTLNANAILTADIDFAQLMPEGADPEETQILWTPIGDWGNTRGTASAAYQGHFDGQGHTIRNLNTTSKQNFFGLFGVISSNCIIENFTIYGTYKSTVQYCGGIAAYARDINPTIRNVHSFVNINNSSAGGRQAGILGAAMVDDANYKTTIEGCTYSGTLDGNDAGGNGNYGGMVGYADSKDYNFVDITNCLFDGQVVNLNSTPGGCTFGGIVGYCNSAKVTIKNCLSVGTVSAADEKFGQFFGALKGTNSKIYNSYYQGDFINGAGSTMTANPQEATLVTDEQLASGEIAWNLNEESFIDVAWYQVLDDQAYPLPYGNDIVYVTNNDDYACVAPEDPTSVATFMSNVIANEQDLVENTIAYQALLDEYGTTVASWESIETYEAFIEAYKAASELRNSIKTSAANYATYVETCENAANYIVEQMLEGATTDFLITYLEDNEGPSEEGYPNGTKAYILQYRELDDTAILAEIAYVNSLLDAAVAADGIGPGKEITRLLTNPTFAEGFEGWTTEAEGPALSYDTEGAIPVAQALDKGTFSVSQTISGLPNGIYMMTTGSLFRAGTDVNSTFYAGQVFMNGTSNYVMAPGEDYIETANAEPGVNCSDDDLVYKLDGDEVGFVPSTAKGASYAFNAGRYQNFVATEVTDGTLTVGVRNLGTGLANDWMPFGDLHLIYLGAASEADKDGKLTQTLQGYKVRANVILDFEYSNDYDSFAQRPNISENLRGQLEDAVLSVDEASDKMALINTFSTLFNEVHACRKAYIEMLGAANRLADFLDVLTNLDLLSNEDYNYWDGKITSAQAHYDYGDISAEQALAIAEELNNCDLQLKTVDGVYQLAKAADLLYFAYMVNHGMHAADAVLVNDIDFDDLLKEGETEITWPTIGDWNTGNTNSAYAGHFDGQGHTIKNFNVTASKNFFGLFGVVTAGCLIENFSITGNMYNDAWNQCGTIGFARDNSVVIRNIHSYLNITNAVNTKTIGGILGHAFTQSTVTIDRCWYSGTFTVTDNGGSDDGMYGGIFGHSYNNSSTHINITNCLFDGKLVNTAASESPISGCVMGGIAGWIGSNVPYSIENCLSIGEVTNTCAGQIAGGLQNNGASYSNNYYKGAAAFGAVAKSTNTTILVTDEQLMSGEVCYKLNGDQTVINWYQTINEDAYPVLDNSHETVLFSEEIGYYNLVNGIPVGIKTIENGQQTTDNRIYNLAGQRLSKMQKGINIVGGHKILVK